MTKGLVLPLAGLILSFLLMVGIAFAQSPSPSPSPSPTARPTVPGGAPSTGLGGLTN